MEASAPNVSQASGSPLSNPRRNQRTRSSELPWFHGLGIRAALRRHLDPIVAHRGGRAQPLLQVTPLELVLHAGAPAPARQSAWSSKRIDSSLA